MNLVFHNIKEFMDSIFKNSKKASYELRKASSASRTQAIKLIGELILEQKDSLLKSNHLDIEAAKGTLSDAMTDRLRLDEKSIKNLADSMFNIASQQDPIGEAVGGTVRPNGLKITQVRVPMGVVGIIYESRPNVTADCAALCLRSGNTAILRGGKEAIHTNTALIKIIKEALKKANLPVDSITLLDDPDRSKMQMLMKAVKYVDLIIPRGGEGLITYVTENSIVPVVKHDKGVCHIYVDEFADFEKALNIVHNAKVSRPSACNAAETVLVHESIASKFLPALQKKLKGVELKGCERTVKIVDVKKVADDDWGTEYLSLTLAVKVVPSVQEAVDHINTHGSGHSDSIVTENYTCAEKFLDEVDSACVYVNASTRFTDGGEFGLGAEVGISTQKLHSRGPMGARDLTTTKYIIHGNGQTR